MRLDKKDLLLYAVTDRTWVGTHTLYDQVKASLEGGVTMLQLREKELSQEAFLKEAIEIQSLCRNYQIPFLINDNLEIALEIKADGVHVGQKDMEAGEARKKLGPDKILGVSAQTVEQALYAQECGADYLGVGAVFPTDTKSDASEVSQETLRQICEAVSIPVVAIGGIGMNNITKLENTGIHGIAVISAIYSKDNITEASQILRREAERIVYGNRMHL